LGLESDGLVGLTLELVEASRVAAAVPVELCYLQTPVLMKVEESGFTANLHPSISSVLEESKWMARLLYKMPDGLLNLHRANIKETLAKIRVGGGHITSCLSSGGSHVTSCL